MEPARPRAGRERDEGVPVSTFVRIQFLAMRPRCGFAPDEKNFKFFEMSGCEIFRKE
jgi:hypothetical protein